VRANYVPSVLTRAAFACACAVCSSSVLFPFVKVFYNTFFVYHLLRMAELDSFDYFMKMDIGQTADTNRKT
jgi:hypothetical protein